MTESNEPTSTGPNAQDRMAKARAAKAAKKTQGNDELAELRAQVAALQDAVKAKNAGDENVRPGPVAKDGQTPGTYIMDKTGKPQNKVRWSRELIERTYPPVTFVAMLTMPVRPHGITRGEWQLAAGKQITAPSIVKDIHDNSLRAIELQTEAYRGFTSEQERAAFEATLKSKGPHFTPVKHVDFGWDVKALEGNARVQAGEKDLDPRDFGHEPEVGFPGGFGGKALAEQVKV